MLVMTTIALTCMFAIATAALSRRGGDELIAHRPYENVRAGLPRSARSTTPLDL